MELQNNVTGAPLHPIVSTPSVPFAPYYDQGGITIYNADCMEVMRQTADESFDLVFTSPPYNKGLRIDGNWSGIVTESCKFSRFRGGYGEHDDAMPMDEYTEWQKKIVKECYRIVSGAVFYNHKQRVVNWQCQLPLFADVPLRQIIVWDTGTGINLHPGAFAPSHEWIMVYAKDSFRLRSKKESAIGDVWRVPKESSSWHPAPFPIGLPSKALSAVDCRSVFDPFMGSGTTLLAAKLFGIKAVGCEVNEEYCEKAAKRLSQGVLF